MSDFIAVFIPIFIAVDFIGILPTFLGLTDSCSKIQRNRITLLASITAFAIGITFMYLGKFLFEILAVSMSDFKVAGGILLFTFALRDLLISGKQRRSVPDEHVGIFPIGMPLIAGPGVLTTLLILQDSYGKTLTLLSLFLNIVIVYVAFRKSDLILKIIGRTTALAIGKIMAIFLGAIGIRLIRSGIMEIIQSSGIQG